MNGAGDLLREVRRSRGLTQEQLAIRAGTTQAAISRLERGEQSPTVAHLADLLRCLGVQLRLEVDEIDPWTEPAHLEAFANLVPSERLAFGLDSVRGLQSLVGGARRAD